ncbi:MAG TPA: ABC transporter permease subunit [Caldilineaceae bacterium]|nr:ABC transporter permease subunit [Caldilineaceae bacterium]
MKLSRPVAIALNLYALLLAAFLIWPVAQVVLTSFTSDIVFPPRYWSLAAFREVLWPGFLQSIWASLKLALAVTFLLVIICLPAAYAIERKRFRGRALLSVLIFVPIIFPVVTYSSAIRVYVFMFFSDWRGSFWLIAIVSAMWPIPLVVRSIQGSLANVAPVYEEAARIMGASPLHPFFRVTVPLIAPGLITAGMIGFTSAATSFVVPQILGANEPVASLYIFRDVGRLGFTPWLAVEGLVMEIIVLGFVQVLYFVFRKQFRGIFV